jgi:hypothetical protein
LAFLLSCRLEKIAKKLINSALELRQELVGAAVGPLYPRNRALTPTPEALFLCNLFYSHYSVFAFGGK